MMQRRRFRRFYQHQTFEGWLSGQDFGDVTSMVNALRNRDIYRYVSVRLLEDLVEVSHGSQQGRKTDAPTRRRAPTTDNGAVLDTDRHLIGIAKASPTLFQRLHLHHKPRRGKGPVRPEPMFHLMLLCQEHGLAAPVEALAQLLAAAIAHQFGETAAAVGVADGKMRLRLWNGPHELGPMEAADYDTVEAMVGKNANPTTGSALVHIIVAAEQPLRQLPHVFQRPDRGDKIHGYDRIIYLTDALPERPPRDLVQALTDGAQGRGRALDGANMGPYFSSFIVSLLTPARPDASSFQIEPVDAEFQLPVQQRHAEAGWRMERDQCRVPFDLDDLRAAWIAYDPHGRRSFPSRLAPTARAHEIATRWARAVTNRRVGVALSGGGASSYRLIPILQGMHDHVPIDLISGCSGGSMVGAYYCHDGLRGLKRCISAGRRIGVATLVRASVDGSVFQRIVDKDLGHTAVTDTDVRLVGLTTALRPGERPAAHVVTGGTLGEAVQVSGAAPLLFAPIEKRVARRPPKKGKETVRFADGATAAFVPARILRDCGADLVLAFNCLPGPQQPNPFDGLAIGRLLYWRTLAGRLVDLWVAGSYLVQLVSRETDEDAHVYFEPHDAIVPLVESFFFTRSATIVRDSAKSAEVKACIAECRGTWNAFIGRREHAG